MSETVAIPYCRSTETDRRRARFLLLSALAGLLIAALGAAIAVPTSSVIRVAPVAGTPTAGAIGEYRARELPREWRWAGKATVDFDHMYRHQTPPRLDWIRAGHAR